MIDVVDWLIAHARSNILQYARADSCIFSTRVAVGFLRKLKLPADPLATKLLVFNPPMHTRMVEHTHAHGQLPPIDLMRSWFADGSGCYSLGLGYGAPPGEAKGYDGHLVCRHGNACIDLSLDQVNRDQHQIHLQPLAFEAPPTFFAGQTSWPLITPSGCGLRYELSDNRAYLDAPDWQRYDRSTELIELLVRAFKAEEANHAMRVLSVR